MTFATLTAGIAFADYTNPCQPSYGNGCGQITKISLVKQVARPNSDNYVNNLTINDEKFKATNEIKFKLTVTNTGNTELKDIVVTDTFPMSYLSYSSSEGKIEGNIITVNINSLAAGASKDIFIKGKVVDNNKLPNDKGIVCDTNMASAKSGDQSSSSSSSFCIEKPVLGKVVYPSVTVPQTPATGAGTLSLLALLPSAIAGFALRKRA